jgi:hypothetical protein
VLVALFAIALKPDRIVVLAAVILDDRPGPGQRMIIARDLVMQNVQIGVMTISITKKTGLRPNLRSRR